MRRRLYPKYVTGFIDRHGKERLRFRRVGYASHYFSAELGTEGFREEYRAAMADIPPAAVQRLHTRPRSINDLLNRYYQSTDFKGNAQPHSLAKRRAILEAFRSQTDSQGIRTGDKSVARAHFAGLDKIIARAAIKKEDGTGGPFAAQSLKKQLTNMFRFAVKIGWIAKNPMEYVSYQPPKTSGFHCWTEDEIEQYQLFWPPGTKQRLAIEMLLWTGKRRSDAVNLGRHNHREGMLWGKDIKTKKDWWLPIAPQLAEAIAAMPPHDHLCYLVSKRGRPYSAQSFGNMFREWCDAAGLPQCSAHGLRKAISRRMAELDINNAGGKSVTLHSGDSEYATYTAAASQKRLATNAIAKISAWQMSNRDATTVSNLEENKA
jgi:integrase